MLIRVNIFTELVNGVDSRYRMHPKVGLQIIVNFVGRNRRHRLIKASNLMFLSSNMYRMARKNSSVLNKSTTDEFFEPNDHSILAIIHTLIVRLYTAKKTL